MVTECQVFESFRGAADAARALAAQLCQPVSVQRDLHGWRVVVSGSLPSARQPRTSVTPSPPPPAVVPLRAELQQEHWYRVSERLLYAIKAFYLGHAISGRPAVTQDARQLIQEALSHFRTPQTDGDRIAKCFYLMLSAEIERRAGEPPIELRNALRETDDECYQLFMRLEEATESRARLEGISTAVIVKPPIERTGFHFHSDGFQAWWVAHDKALKAFGLRERDLSLDQQSFLSRTTLLELLERHGVRAAP